MSNLSKKYKVKVYEDGDVILELISESGKKFLVHKIDFNEYSVETAARMHDSLQQLEAGFKVLTIPKTSELEVIQID